jgi:DNA helicase II / ATP-dependent DNA helicase PcrA
VQELTENEKEYLKEEERIFEETMLNLHIQKDALIEKLEKQKTESRELTSILVQTRRSEDKAQAHYDESIAHSLYSKSSEDLDRLIKIINKPYFGRIKIEETEQTLKGEQKKRYEFKIGHFANVDCRILDWKHAPMAKLYFSYKEGELFLEEIQDREREGVVIFKNRIEIKDSKLHSAVIHGIEYKKLNGSWSRITRSFSEMQPLHDAERPPSATSDTEHTTQEKLAAYLSSEQYDVITHNASSPFLITGVAGSGKTSVGIFRLSRIIELHRMSYPQKENALHAYAIVTKSETLKRYIYKQLLPAFSLTESDIKVYTYKELCLSFFQDPFWSLQPKTPATVKRIKSSEALFFALRNVAQGLHNTSTTLNDCFTHLEALLHRPQEVLSYDTTKLINKDALEVTLEHTRENREAHRLDEEDISLLTLFYQYTQPQKTVLFSHIVADEIQDFSLSELATIINCVEKNADLSFIGDFNQDVSGSKNIASLVRLLKENKRREDEQEKLINFKISHRTTLPILKLAAFINGTDLPRQGRDGRVPILFETENEEAGILAIIKWIEKALSKYPHELTAVLCKSKEEAKYVTTLLRSAFGNTLLHLTDITELPESGIVVSDIQNVKGLEFSNVILYNPDTQSYPAGGESRKLLYIAVSRAIQNVCTVIWGKLSEIFPKRGSSERRGLLRYVDMRSGMDESN